MAIPTQLSTSQWMRVLDQVVHAGLNTNVEAESLLPHLRGGGLTVEEEQLIRSEVTASSAMVQVVALIRQRPSLAHAFRTGIGEQDAELAAVIDKAVENVLDSQGNPLPSTMRCDVRWRLAVKSLKTEINALAIWAIPGLYEAACLSGRECDDIKEEKISLVDCLTKKHEEHFGLLRNFLEGKQPDLLSALDAAFQSVSLENANPYVHSAPRRPLHFVSRPLFSNKIKDWFGTDDSQQVNRLLLLSGMGSIGKSSLAIDAAYESFNHGFHRVIWLEAGDSDVRKCLRLLARILGLQTEIGESETELAIAISEKVSALCSQGDRLLLIIDDLVNEKTLRHVSCFDWVLATSRDADVGNSTPFLVTRIKLEEAGLTKDESEKLLANILGGQKINKMKELEMFNRTQKLLDDHHRFPLTVNIVGSLLLKDEMLWNSRGVQLLDDLSDTLTEMKEKIWSLTEQVKPSGTHYRYENVYCALLASYERLSGDQQKQYEMLAVFDRGGDILPTTMSRFWKSTDHFVSENNARLLLDVFWGRSLLQRVCHGDSSHYVYRLHELQFDVLRYLTKGNVQDLRRAAVRSYEDCLASVPQADSFFYQKFVRFCLETGEMSLAFLCLKQLSYTVTRIRLGFTDGLLAEFEDVTAKAKSDDDLKLYHSVVSLCLSSAVARNDPDIVLRAALLHSHEDEVYLDARRIVCDEGRGDQFLEYARSPERVRKEQLSLYRQIDIGTELIDDEAHLTCVDVSDKGDTVLFGYNDGSVCLYDWKNMKVLSLGRFNEKILLVKYLDEQSSRYFVVTTSHCLFVEQAHSIDSRGFTELCVTSAGLGEAGGDDKGRFSVRDAKFVANYVWLLVGHYAGCQLRCYNMDDFQLTLVKSFVCAETFQYVGVRCCGRIAVATGDAARSEVFDIDAVSSNQLPRTGRAAGFLNSRSVVQIRGHFLYKDELLEMGSISLLLAVICFVSTASSSEDKFTSSVLALSLCLFTKSSRYFSTDFPKMYTYRCILGVCLNWVLSLSVLIILFMIFEPVTVRKILTFQFESFRTCCISISVIYFFNALCIYFKVALYFQQKVNVLCHESLQHHFPYFISVYFSVYVIGRCVLFLMGKLTPPMSPSEMVCILLLLVIMIFVGVKPVRQLSIIALGLTILLCHCATLRGESGVLGMPPENVMAFTTFLHCASWFLLFGQFRWSKRKLFFLRALLVFDGYVRVVSFLSAHTSCFFTSSWSWWRMFSFVTCLLTTGATVIENFTDFNKSYAYSTSVVDIFSFDGSSCSSHQQHTISANIPKSRSAVYKNLLLWVHGQFLYFSDIMSNTGDTDDDHPENPRSLALSKEFGRQCQFYICKDYLFLFEDDLNKTISAFSLRTLLQPAMCSASVPVDELDEPLNCSVLKMQWMDEFKNYMVVYSTFSRPVFDGTSSSILVDRTLEVQLLGGKKLIAMDIIPSDQRITVATNRYQLAVVNNTDHTITQHALVRLNRGANKTVSFLAESSVSVVCYVGDLNDLLIAMRMMDGRWCLSKFANEEVTELFRLPGPVTRLHASAELDCIICQCDVDGSRFVTLWGLQDSTRYLEDELINVGRTDFKLSKDGRRVAFVNTARSLVIWDVEAKSIIYCRRELVDEAHPLHITFCDVDHRLLFKCSTLSAIASVLSEVVENQKEAVIELTSPLGKIRSVHWPSSERLAYLTFESNGRIATLNLDAGTVTSVFDSTLGGCSSDVKLVMIDRMGGQIFILKDKAGRIHTLKRLSSN